MGAARRLRGCEKNVHKRYLIHVAGHNLGILMRLLIGAGTSKEAPAAAEPSWSSFAPRKPSRSLSSQLPTTGFALLIVTVTAGTT